MQRSNFIFQLMLCMSLLVPAAMAEGISVPDKNQRQGMSYEEYSNFREKMRLQMANKKPEDLKPKQAPSTIPIDQAEKPIPNRAYGKGYHMRNTPEDRPDAGNRPDRPRVEKFNRGDMGRR